MSDNKQSSVEWLHEQLTLTWYDYNSSKDILDQAKAMHKVEIMQSLNDGKSMALGTMVNTSLEQYYNEIYGGNNE